MKKLTQEDIDLICDHADFMWFNMRDGSKANYSPMHFQDVDLGGLDLTRLDSKTKFTNVDFTGANLNNFDFSESEIIECIYTDEELKVKSFAEAVVRNWE